MSNKEKAALPAGEFAWPSTIPIFNSKVASPLSSNEKIEGYTTSAAYAHSLGRAVAIGYIQTSRYTAGEHLERGSFEVEIAGTRHAAKASLRAFFDPKGERLRS